METELENQSEFYNFNPAITKIVLLTASFFAVLNETYLNVALGSFMKIFNVSMPTVQWLTTGFILVMTTILPTTTFFIKRYTTRHIFFATMFLLILGTTIGGFAQSFSMLLIGRLTQAAGTCVLLSLLINTILIITPKHKRGAAMGTMGLIIIFAPAIAPSFAGTILDFYNWRYLFFALLPLFIIITVAGIFTIRNVSKTSPVKIDIISVIFSFIGFGSILYSISRFGDTGIDIHSIASFIIGCIGIGLFVSRQLKLNLPLLELRIFKYPTYSFGIFILMANMMIIFAVMVITPMFLQEVAGLSAFITGLVMLPGGVLNGLASLVAGKVYDRVGSKILIITGMPILIVSVFMFAAISSSTEIWMIITLHCFMLVSAALVITATQTNSLQHIPQKYYSHGTAIMLTLQQMAGALGTVIFVTILSVQQESHQHHLTNMSESIQHIVSFTYGFHHAFIFGMILLTMAFFIAMFKRQHI